MASAENNKRVNYIKRSIASASEFNTYLNRQRQRVYVDLQTDTTNYPVGLGRQNITLTQTQKVGRYPVAVLPCQYQDWYIDYTPTELEYLPVNTVLKGPIMRLDQLPPLLTTPDVSDFDSSSSCSASSCCSCCESGDAEQAGNASMEVEPENEGEQKQETATPRTPLT